MVLSANGKTVVTSDPQSKRLMLHGMVESLLYLEGETPLIIAGFNRDKASVFSLTKD